MDMKLIMYTSTATAQSSVSVPADLFPIARTCRENNPNYDITGGLYYRYGQYLQIIEGEPKSVNQLMRNILKDRRHEKCFIHVETIINKRIYPKWQCQLSMVIERDPYLRRFLTQFSDKLQSPNAEMEGSLNHFFKKQTPQRSNNIKAKKITTTPVDVFGCEVMSLTRLPDFSLPGVTFLMMKLCHLLAKKPHSVDQLIVEYGEDKRDEILVSLKNLNNQGLIQFVDG